MKERQIPFSAPMVRALLNDTKTQTRRVAKLTDAAHVKEPRGHRRWHPADPDASMACPYGQPGDRLWVREAWKAHPTFDNLPPRDIPQTHVWYMADEGYKAESRHRNGMFMPRWASRINLEITAVRVERLQDISAADAQAEGIVPDGDGGWHLADTRHYMGDPISSYASLWEYINGPDSWNANPWVWVIEFKKVTA